MVQPFQECLQLQELEPGGGQFNRQGQAIQTPADLRNQRSRDGGQLKRGLNLPCPLEEERHGYIVRERLVVGKVLWIRQSQRLDDKLAFSPHMQHLAARHQQLEVRTGGEQVHQSRRCRHHLLEIVQHEHQVLLKERRLQHLQWRLGAALQAKRLHHGGKYQVGILNGGERDEADPIRKLLLHLGRDGNSQACLAHPSRASEGEEPHLRTQEQGTSRSDLPLTTNKRGE